MRVLSIGSISIARKDYQSQGMGVDSYFNVNNQAMCASMSHSASYISIPCITFCVKLVL